MNNKTKETNMETVRKLDLVTGISARSGIPKEEVSEVIRILVSEIKNNVAQNKKVVIRGFGAFYPKYAKEKKVRDIGRNKEMVLPAHYKPRFEPSPKFKSAVKSNLKV